MEQMLIDNLLRKEDLINQLFFLAYFEKNEAVLYEIRYAFCNLIGNAEGNVLNQFYL